MEMIYATVVGLGIATVLRYLIPGRHSYGILLLPAIGAAWTAVAWTALTWVGWKPDEPWIWVISLGGSGVIAIVLALVLNRARRGIDAERLHRLSGGRASRA